MNGFGASPQGLDKAAPIKLLHIAAILAKERATPVWDFVMRTLGSTVLLIAQFAFLRGLDPSGDALRYLALARTAFAFSGGQHLERFLIDGYMSGSLMMDVITPLNLPRLKSRDSCFIDRCHCWSCTVSTGVASGSSCRTN